MRYAILIETLASSTPEPSQVEALIQRLLGPDPQLTPRRLDPARAIIMLDSPETTHDTALAFLDRLQRHRRGMIERQALVDFRLGASSGEDDVTAVTGAMQLAQSGQAATVTISRTLFEALSPLARESYESTAPQGDYRSIRLDLRTCFVVMPMADATTGIGQRREEVFARYIRPACAKLSVRPIRPDKQSGDRVLSDILGMLELSDFVVAYLGSAPWNANTMVEVGYRWATGRPMVLLSDGTLPFDLDKLRTVLLDDSREGDPTYVAGKVQELFQRLAAPRPSTPAVHASAMILVDRRPNVCDDERRHAISEASDATADLFGIARDQLIGMHPAQVIGNLSKLMDDRDHFSAFCADQDRLYQHLSSEDLYGKTDRRAVHATVPMIFRKHPKPTYNQRAFLPVIVSNESGEESSRQRVLYLEVTNAVRRTRGGGYVCTLPQANPMLVFEAYATRYDRVLPKLPNYREMLERHLRRIEPKPGMHVLDLGAGTGNLSLELLRRGAHVTAVDVSTAMLNELRQKLDRLRCETTGNECDASELDERIEIVQQDGSNLSPWRDGTFDAVNISLMLFSIMDVDLARMALREAMRVLKPAGLLVITEPNQSFRMRTLLDDTRRALEANGRWNEVADDWEAIEAANETIGPENRETVPAEDIETTLKAAGYTVSGSRAYKGHCTTLVARKAA
jgi:ubiquinone/menaquinone biosynthesis C-methylase UbiE